MDSSDDELLNVFASQWEASEVACGSQNSLNSQPTSVAEKSDVPDSKSLEVLFKKFGHRSFRPFQWQIINSVLKHKRDNCAIMTTGYGKSLCYQFPAVFSGGVTLVISPLISLMEDQVLSLTIANIPACLLGSAQRKSLQTIEEILEKKFSVVYLTPEFCTTESGINLLKDMKSRLRITLIAVDEAHCVSSWGHDFRHSYRQLGMLKDILPEVPILAVTATATEVVKKDIVKSLKLKNPQIVCTGFDRPNLYFAAILKGSNIFDDLKQLMIRRNGEWIFDGPTIIYCITRKDTETISDLLKYHDVPCLPYHAGLTLGVRKHAHEQFVEDKISVVVATIAFGMGIDKPDIRHVIHYGSSGSVESYYQEVGRAGRDGLPSKCITFYSSHDFQTHGFLIENGSNSSQRSELLDTMKQYLNSRKCRREFLVSYFEGKGDLTFPQRNDCCDNCFAKCSTNDQPVYEGIDDSGLYDFTDDAVKYLSTVTALGGKFGHGMYILFLRGSKNSKISDRHRRHPVYGSGKDKSEDWWKAIANILELKKYIKQIKQKTANSFSYTVFDVSDNGRKFLNTPPGSKKVLEEPTQGILNLLKKRAPSGWISSHGAPCFSDRPTASNLGKTQETSRDIDERLKLMRLLKNTRSQLARSNNCMPYMVASDYILMEMARHKPRNLEQFQALKIEGLTEARIDKFGQQLLEVVKNNSTGDSKNTILDILRLHPVSSEKLCISSSISYADFEKCKSVEQVAAKRNLATSTIFGHLIACLKHGYPIKLEELGVGPTVRQPILKAIHQLGGGYSQLTPIKHQCPDAITFDEIKCVCAYLLVRNHLKELGIPFEEFDPVENLAVGDTSDENSNAETDCDVDDDLLSALVDKMEEQIEVDEKQQLFNDLDIEHHHCTTTATESNFLQVKRARVDDGIHSPPEEKSSSCADAVLASSANDASEVTSNTTSKKKLPVWLMKKRV